jgi:hypothetical protein
MKRITITTILATMLLSATAAFAADSIDGGNAGSAAVSPAVMTFEASRSLQLRMLNETLYPAVFEIAWPDSTDARPY